MNNYQKILSFVFFMLQLASSNAGCSDICIAEAASKTSYYCFQYHKILPRPAVKMACEDGFSKGIVYGCHQHCGEADLLTSMGDYISRVCEQHKTSLHKLVRTTCEESLAAGELYGAEVGEKISDSSLKQKKEKPADVSVPEKEKQEPEIAMPTKIKAKRRKDQQRQFEEQEKVSEVNLVEEVTENGLKEEEELANAREEARVAYEAEKGGLL